MYGEYDDDDDEYDTEMTPILKKKMMIVDTMM